MVESVGGRFGTTKAIPIDYVSVLADLFDEWARPNARHRADGLYFSGRPGLWRPYAMNLGAAGG